MEKEEKTEKNPNKTNTEETLKKIPKYLVLICILLVVLIVRLEKANSYLRTIAENGTNVIEYETFDDTFIEIITEESKEKEDYIPLLEELTDEETTSETTQKNSSKETTTKKHNETTTTQKSDDNVSRKTYVLNTSSKKIHLPDCSFVSRTKEENKKTVKLSTEELNQYKNDGYVICKTCGGD